MGKIKDSIRSYIATVAPRRTRQLPPSRLRPNFSRSNAQPTSIPSCLQSKVVMSFPFLTPPYRGFT
ncbi:hypothetical protein NC653_029848 [Populus alba x Populus x berolinensis]|uniref:Uncharacterized protein n=1 Tax=Populus alba x Populus x berolinensis TaxID=444605 RepID=A0AAD6M3I1_9ROSI|nr:hypothetical protein NC653_029848 [Populus alba x Populus x berolinensis]